MSDTERKPPFTAEHKKKFGLFIDADNLLISVKNIPEFRGLNPLHLLKAAVHYAEGRGKLILPYIFITTKSDHPSIFVSQALQDFGLSVNLVPPFPDAADREIEKMVREFILYRADLDGVVLVGRDVAAFRPLCKALIAAGKEVDVVTPGTSSGGMMRIATRTVSIFSLMKLMKNKEGAVTLERQGKKYARKKTSPVNNLRMDFIGAAIKIARGDDVRPGNEQFVQDCLTAVKRVFKFFPHLTFKKMVEETWNRVVTHWTKYGFTREEHCKKALNALIDQQIVKRIGEEIIEGKIIAKYALKTPRHLEN
jgi:hypothetical protein